LPFPQVLLPTTNRAENVKKADRIHTVLRTATVFTEGFSGVLAVVLLPEDYSNAGVYVGTWHGISRAVLWFLCVALMTFIYKMGTSIKNALANGGQKKVAPEPAAGEKVVKKKGDDEKIAGMIKWTIGIMCIVLVYLLLDISRSIGKYRFVNEPFCEAKALFVRLPSIIQLGTALAVTHVFPVKKPDVKGKTNMMGTTVVSTSSG
jgi:hypothetical protein